MSLSNEIKSLLVSKSLKQQDLQESLEMASKQAVNNKFAKNAWSAEDLYKVLTFLGGQVILKVDDREIVLTEKHFEKKKKVDKVREEI